MAENITDAHVRPAFSFLRKRYDINGYLYEKTGTIKSIRDDQSNRLQSWFRQKKGKAVETAFVVYF